MLGVIEMAVVMAFISSESLKQFHYAEIEPLVRFLISEGVNVDINRMRLVETLWALGREEEAKREKQALLADIGDDVPAPPLHSHWHGWRNYRLWLLKARVRVAWMPPLTADLIKARLAVIREEFDNLQKRFGGKAKCGKWLEFQTISQDLARLQAT
jgi:hypothetical protein